jgi:hypothetical protein
MPPHSTVKCNFRKGNQTFNLCAVMPKQYYKDDRVQVGVLKVMALANIQMGWKPRAKFHLGPVDLLHFAAMRIGAEAIKEPRCGRKRTKKV